MVSVRLWFQNVQRVSVPEPVLSWCDSNPCLVRLKPILDESVENNRRRFGLNCGSQRKNWKLTYDFVHHARPASLGTSITTIALLLFSRAKSFRRLRPTPSTIRSLCTRYTHKTVEIIKK